MNASECVDKLVSLIGRHPRAGSRYDWPTIENSINLELPEDYKLLLETFPNRPFRDLVTLNRPGDYGEPKAKFLGFYGSILEDMRGWRREGRGPEWAGSFPYPIFPEPGGLLPWAHGPNLEPVFWLTQPPTNPENWAVVVPNHDFSTWHIFELRASEFLIEIAEGHLDNSMFGMPPVRIEMPPRVADA